MVRRQVIAGRLITTTGAAVRTKLYAYDLRGNLESKTSSVAGDVDAIWYNNDDHPYPSLPT